MFGIYRTFLALMVVVLHLGGIPKIGAYAVFGFYIISGYLMTLIMQTTYGYTVSGVSRYALNRFLRIYPIYWISIMFSALLVWCLGADFTSNYHSAIYFPKNLLELFNNVFLFFPFRESPRLTPPAWALTVEIFFYVLIGLGLSRNKRTTVIWFIVSVMYHIFGVIFQLNWEQRYFTVVAASLPFATGALIFHYRSELTRPIDRLKGGVKDYLPYILLAAILANWYLGHLTSQLAGKFFYSNYILCAFVVIVLSGRTTLPYINKKIDTWLGDFSYPIYLIHYQIGLVIVIVYRAAGVELNRPGLVVLFSSIPLILLCSWIITLAIERPIELLRTRVKS